MNQQSGILTCNPLMIIHQAIYQDLTLQNRVPRS